jgi:hypothetical protein
MNDLRSGIIKSAESLGISPFDLATAISYETAGTFDPQKAGPTTQYGTHKGLIQFGEPQARQYGVDWNNPVESQLGENGAIVKYLKSAGVKEGMGLLDIYSAINAGKTGLYDRTDAQNGGARGTVRDKVERQMAQHAEKAKSLIGDYDSQSANMSDDDYLNSVFSDNPQQNNDLNSQNNLSDDDYLNAVFSGNSDTEQQQQNINYTEQEDKPTQTYDSSSFRTGLSQSVEPDYIVDESGSIRRLGEGNEAGLGTQALSGLPVDLTDRIAVFAKARGLPVSRYGMTKDGDIYYIDDKGQAQREEGSSAIDYIARSSGDLITTGGEALGAFGGSFFGGAGAGAGATVGAGLGDVARQKLAQSFAGVKEYSPLQTASEVAFAALPAMGEGAIAKYGNRNAVRELDNLDLTKAENLQKSAQEQGISLTPAEVTDSRTLKRKQSVLGQISGSDEVMDDFYRKRNLEQIPQAIDKNISKIGNSYEGFSNFSKAVDDITQSNVKSASAKMKPFYDNVKNIAESNNVTLDVSGLTSQINDELKRVPSKSPMGKDLKKLSDMVNSIGKDNVVSFEQANELKKSIDEMIDYRGIAQDKATPRLKSIAMDIKNKLKDQMIEAVPEYAETLFEAQKIITQLEKTNNPLAKFISKDDVLYGDDFIERGFHKMMNKATPKKIFNLKSQFIKNGKEKEFNDGLASYLENQFLKIGDTADETIGVGAKFVNRIAKTPKQRMGLRAALGEETYKGFENFLEILQATGSVKRTGSQTAPFKEMKDDIGRSFTSGVMDYIKNIDLARPSTLIPMGETARRWALESDKEYYRKLASYMTSDRGLKNLKELSQISPLSRKARKAVAYISAELLQKTQRDIADRMEAESIEEFNKEINANPKKFLSGD